MLFWYSMVLFSLFRSFLSNHDLLNHDLIKAFCNASMSTNQIFHSVCGKSRSGLYIPKQFFTSILIPLFKYIRKIKLIFLMCSVYPFVFSDCIDKFLGLRSIIISIKPRAVIIASSVMTYVLLCKCLGSNFGLDFLEFLDQSF